MNKLSRLVWAAAIVPLVAAMAGGDDSETRAARELRMANLAIAARLAVQANPRTRNLCGSDPVACMGPSNAELGLAFIARYPSKASARELARLLRFKLDGGLGSDFQCYVLEKGVAVRGELLRASGPQLRKQCEADVRAVIPKESPLFDNFDVASVCSDEQYASARAKELAEAIDKKATCAEGDF